MHAQVFQESPEVLHTPHLVPPPQDCSAFWLVSVCTMEEDANRPQISAVHITYIIPMYIL